MDALHLLEKKISSLIAIVQNLKEKNEQLADQDTASTKEKEGLKAQYAKLSQENSRLLEKIKGLEKNSLEGNDQIDELSEEKALTKIAVDDLLERLKSIDSLVEKQ